MTSQRDGWVRRNEDTAVSMRSISPSRDRAALWWAAWLASFFVIGLLSIAALVVQASTELTSPIVVTLLRGSTVLSVLGVIASVVGMTMAEAPMITTESTRLDRARPLSSTATPRRL